MRLGPPPTRNRQRFPFVGTLEIPGLPRIRVETAAGQMRLGTDPDGKPWAVKMPAHYGEFERTEGADGDPVDVFVGEDPHAAFAYVVHVAHADGSGRYDECKVFVGFSGREAVETTFREAYSRTGLKLGVRKLSIPQLAGWLADRDNRGKKIMAGREMAKALSVGIVLFGVVHKATEDGPLDALAVRHPATPSEEAVTAPSPDGFDPFDGIGEHEKGKVFADEEKAQKAHQRVVEQYGATEADGERYWRLKAGIYKRMGGTFAGRPEAGKATDRHDKLTISMLDLLGPGRGGKLHQETRTDRTGRTEQRWVSGPTPQANKRKAKPVDPDDPPAPPPDIATPKDTDRVWWICQRGHPIAGPYDKKTAEREHASIKNKVQKRAYQGGMLTADGKQFRAGLGVAPKGASPPGLWPEVFRGLYQRYGYSTPQAVDLYDQATGKTTPRPDWTATQLKRLEGVRPPRPDVAKALAWLELPEAVKAISRKDKSTLSMFDLFAPAPAAAPAAAAPTGDTTHGGKLHPETRTDATGRTQTRWVASPEAEPPPEPPSSKEPEPPEPEPAPQAEPAPEPPEVVEPEPASSREPEPEPPAPVPIIFPDPASDPKGHAVAVGRALMLGAIDADRLRQEWAKWKAAELHVKVWLAKKTVPELKRMVMYANGLTKAQLVDRIHSGLAQRFHPSDVLTHSMFETSEQAIGREIAGATDDDLKKYADKVGARIKEREDQKKAHEDAQAEKERRMADPKTAEDYEDRIASKGRDSLTPEQKIEADELIAQRDRGRRESAEAQTRAAAEERRAKAAADARPSRDLTPDELEARIEEFRQRLDSATRSYASAYETRNYGTSATTRRLNMESAINAGKDVERWRRRLDHARAVLAWKRGQEDNPGEEPGEGGARPQVAAAADGGADGATTAGRASKGSPLKGSAMTLHAGVHTKKGHAIWTAEMHDRVDRDTYDRLNRAAKAGGGYYSSYRGGGAIPGFVFDDEDAAHRFMAAHGGVATASPSVATAGEDAAAEEGEAEAPDAAPEVEEEIPEAVTGPAARAAKLRELADSTHAAAQDVLNQDRKTNTLRRAEMAAGIAGRAMGQQFIANTTRNIADAMEAGTLKHLHGVSARRHVEALEDALRAAHYDAVREASRKLADSGHWRSSDDVWHAPPTLDDIEHARSPHVRTRREQLRRLVEQYEAMPPQRRRGLKEAAEVARKHGLDYGASDRGDHIAVIPDYDVETLRPLVERLSRVKGYDGHHAREVADDMQEARRWRRMGIHSAEELRAALREYHGLRGSKPKPDRIKEMQRELVGTKIPGYFPTPPALARQAVALADIQPGHRVLEPSAGSGHMAREIKAAHPDAQIETIEQAPKLRELLKEQGFNVVHNDHMEHDDAEGYDRIVMNPPFEAGQDAEHIQRAYEKLKPGGRMVAIMSEGPFFRQDRKSQAFRDWLDEKNGESQKLPAGSFAGTDADRTTGVSTRMVVVNKPHTPAADPLKMGRREYLEAYGATPADIRAIEAAPTDEDGEPIRPGGDDNGHATAPDWGQRAANAVRDWHHQRRMALESEFQASQAKHGWRTAGDRDTIIWEPQHPDRPKRITIRRGQEMVGYDSRGWAHAVAAPVTGISHGAKRPGGKGIYTHAHTGPTVRLATHGDYEFKLGEVYTPEEAEAMGWKRPAPPPATRKQTTMSAAIERANRRNAPPGGWTDDDAVPEPTKAEPGRLRIFAVDFSRRS